VSIISLAICLSVRRLTALCPWQLAFGGQIMELPPSLHVAFDFRAAMAEGGIVSLEIGPDCDEAWLEAELA
jgi:hypothetical protein